MPADTGRRRGAALAVAAGVLAAHLLLLSMLPASRLGSGAADGRPARIEVSFVRELAQATPPATAPRPAPPRPARRALAAAAPASAPASAAERAPEPAERAASATEAPASDTSVAVAEPVPDAAELQAAAAAAAPPPASAASAASTFEWPPSTRLTYALTGHYRGPVEGQATVEWLRSGSRYQVHLEIGVGPSFAPLISRRITSDGELTAEGLRPLRFDEETHVALRPSRRVTIHFDEDTIRLPDGRQAPRPPGVQDTASQFVQLTWMFTMQPQLLQPGRSITLPLALPRRVDEWTYDVLAHETLDTPVGSIATLHVKPRRAPKPGVELTAELWVAPSLQYLPVRILIRQDAETWIDMLVLRLPQQAAEPAPATGR